VRIRLLLLALPGLSGLADMCRAEQSPPVAIDAGPAELAPSDLGPPKKPPPVRLPHPPVPALPDLPAISANEAPASAPAGLLLSNENPCHGVWTGTQAAPLGCARSLLFGSESGGASLVVARTLLSRDPTVLPAVVDHRLDGTEGPLRDQLKAPACTAFATATALDHALSRWGGKNPAVSVMQIWSRYHSPYVETSLTSNVGQPLGPEQQWPFSATEAMAWVPCADYPKPPSTGCGLPVDDARAKRIGAASVGEFTEVEYLGAQPDPRMLEAKIASGQDVIVTIELPPVFVPKGRAGARYIPHYTKTAGTTSSHALVLAGYARLPHGTYFLAHNSWGPGWGDGGYAWVHQATLQAWTHETIAVDAEPVDRDPASRARRQRGETTCASNLVPDSIRGTCTPPCLDQSPRHDGVCPVAGQCSESYVNLTGACVLAAPIQTGRDALTGVTWSCGPGGCTYELPRASDPGCTGSVCRASCPAPDFHLAKMGDAMVCVE
jgi:hypothetical protein